MSSSGNNDGPVKIHHYCCENFLNFILHTLPRMLSWVLSRVWGFERSNDFLGILHAYCHIETPSDISPLLRLHPLSPNPIPTSYEKTQCNHRHTAASIPQMASVSSRGWVNWTKNTQAKINLQIEDERLNILENTIHLVNHAWLYRYFELKRLKRWIVAENLSFCGCFGATDLKSFIIHALCQSSSRGLGSLMNCVPYVRMRLNQNLKWYCDVCPCPVHSSSMRFN